MSSGSSSSSEEDGEDEEDDGGGDDLLNLKIAHAHSRYEAGQVAIIQRVVGEKSTMERDEWEALLAPTDPALAMTDADLMVLLMRQDQEAKDAAARAKAESPIDLDAIRGDPAAVKEFCAAMPREAMLHVHPSGTRNLQTIQEMLMELDPIVNSTDILAEANDQDLAILYDDEVAALELLPVQKYSEFDAAGRSVVEELFFLPEDQAHDFKRFEALFRIADVLLEQDESKEQYVTEKTYLDFALRSQALGLGYVEFTKVQIPATREKLDEFAALKKFVEDNSGLTVNFNYAFVRTISPPALNTGWATDLVELIADMPEDAAVGIDLLANEVGTPALETAQGIYVQILNARESGYIDLKSTMHSGELGDLRNVRDAMIMGAQRIGHGVLLQQDPVALEWARAHNVGTVCSLVSNQLLDVHFPYSTHPFLRYLRLGMPVSLSTDDEGMFRTDIANECEIVVTSTDIEYSELAMLSRNAITESFADEATKATLMATLNAELAAFEAAWGN